MGVTGTSRGISTSWSDIQVRSSSSLKLCTASRGILSFSHHSSGSSGRVGGTKKHEVHAAAFSGHFFMTYFYRTGGVAPCPPPDPLLHQCTVNVVSYLFVFPSARPEIQRKQPIQNLTRVGFGHSGRSKRDAIVSHPMSIPGSTPMIHDIFRGGR